MPILRKRLLTSRFKRGKRRTAAVLPKFTLRTLCAVKEAVMDYNAIAGHSPCIAAVNNQLTWHINLRTEEALRQNAAARTVTTKEELEARAQKMRSSFAASLGRVPYDPSAPLNARVTGVLEEEGLRIEKVIFLSRPGVYVTANVYLPAGLPARAPAILFQPGHAADGKAYPNYQRVARILAGHGLIVMSMDPIGQGERLSYWVKGEEKPRVGGACADHERYGDALLLAGESAAAHFLADAMRAVDYLVSRPDVDPARIGATGSSGGGTMTSVLSVMDPRIAAAAPGTFLTTREAITHAAQWQDCEQMWRGSLAAGFDHHEVLACFCPKPLLILAVDADSFPLDGTYEIFAYGKNCYTLAGHPDNLRMTVDESTHAFTAPLADAAGRFFTEVFGVPDRPVNTAEVPTLPEAALFCTGHGQVVWDIPDARPIYEQATAVLAAAPALCDEERTAALAAMVYAGRTPPPIVNLRTYAVTPDKTVRYVLWQTQRNLPCYGALLTRTPGERQPVTVCLFRDGMAGAARESAAIDAILDAGRTAFVVNLSGMGRATPPAVNNCPTGAISGIYFKCDCDLTFLGDSFCALRAYDLLKTCELVKNFLQDETPEIYAAEEACIYARVVERLCPGVTVRVHDEVNIVSYLENPYYDAREIFTVRAQGLAQYLK